MGFDVHLTELIWDDAEAISYEEALERLDREFRDGREPVDVTIAGVDGDLQVTFTARLLKVSAYDEVMPPTIGLEFEGGAYVVLSREKFMGAYWLEQPGPMRPVEKAVRFSIDDRHIEFTHP